MSRGAHFKRSRLTPVGAAGAGTLIFGVFLGSAAAQPLGDVVPAPPSTVATDIGTAARASVDRVGQAVGDVQIGDAIRVTRENPAPHTPAVAASAPRKVARVLSPCTAKRGQLKAVETDLRAVYRTPTALELADDAGTIARALYEQCGWRS